MKVLLSVDIIRFIQEKYIKFEHVHVTFSFFSTTDSKMTHPNFCNCIDNAVTCLHIFTRKYI